MVEGASDLLAIAALEDLRVGLQGDLREQAPPDPGFRDRLRALAEAAGAMRDAHARALQAGLAWRPVADSERARPPYELRHGTGRRGPTEQLNQAGGGDNLADVVDVYAAVAQAASELADALQATGE